MKKSTLLIFIFIPFLSLLFSSCEKDIFYTYIIKNDTDYNINIIGFDKIQDPYYNLDSALILSETLVIPPYSEISEIRLSGRYDETQGIFTLEGIDSLTIVFDSLRIITYSSNEAYANETTGKYNLINYDDNYNKINEIKTSGETSCTYVFEFNQTDFENAESL